MNDEYEERGRAGARSRLVVSVPGSFSGALGDVQIFISDGISAEIPSLLHPSPCPARQDNARKQPPLLVSSETVILNFVLNKNVTAPARHVRKTEQGLLSGCKPRAACLGKGCLPQGQCFC